VGNGSIYDGEAFGAPRASWSRARTRKRLMVGRELLVTHTVGLWCQSSLITGADDGSNKIILAKTMRLQRKSSHEDIRRTVVRATRENEPGPCSFW